MNNAQEIVQTQKPIPDSGLHYTLFTHKPHTCNLFNHSIADEQFLTSHSLTFKPSHVTYKIPPSAGTPFNVHVHISI